MPHGMPISRLCLVLKLFDRVGGGKAVFQLGKEDPAAILFDKIGANHLINGPAR